MGLKKGMKPNNPSGRPVGATGKVSGELKDWISQLVSDNRAQIIIDLKLLEPNQRLIYMEKLFSYLLPKPTQQIEAEVEDKFNTPFMKAMFPNRYL